MFIDQQTLFDLEIFPKKPGDPALCALLDTTKTDGGQRQLKQVLTSPLATIPEIQERHILLNYLLKYRTTWEGSLDNTLYIMVERYLHSNIIPLSSNNPAILLINRWIYRDNFLQLFQGISALKTFLQTIHALYVQHHNISLPQELFAILSLVRELVTQPMMADFLAKPIHHKWSLFEVWRYDCVFRNDIRHQLLRLLERLYQLDAYLSLAQAIEKYHLSFPRFIHSDCPCFQTTGLYHPFLQSPKGYVLQIHDDKHFLFLTGPNMAGKTTFMKACGIAVYLAHLGMAVPAQTMDLTVYDTLVSDITTEDNIRLGYSYFYSEVKRVKDIAELMRNHAHAFILLDELFNGTNMHDAYEASKRVIQGFAQWPNHLFILSSHLVELAPDITQQARFLCKYFDAHVIQGNPIYSYELKDGITQTRLGLTILEKERVFELLYR